MQLNLTRGLDPLTQFELRRQNPWWQERAMPPLPAFRRWPFARLRGRLLHSVAPILVLRGPRRVGKTTLLEQPIATPLRDERVAPGRIFRSRSTNASGCDASARTQSRNSLPGSRRRSSGAT